MENMDNGLSAKMGADIPKISQNKSAQFVCPSLKLSDIDEKRFHRASVVRVYRDVNVLKKQRWFWPVID